MASLNDRIKSLERTIAAAVRKRPMKFYRLPAVGEAERAAVQAEIDAHKKAGRDCITYEIV